MLVDGLLGGLLGGLDIWSLYIPTPMALAAVALIGYLFGQRTRHTLSANAEQIRHELKRAKLVAKQLEQIANTVRRDLASHRASVSNFRDRISTLSATQSEEAWRELCREAEEVLKPTLRLASQMSRAYDEIRQQSTQLMSFTEIRRDPLTGVHNRRGLDETLDNMFAMKTRYERPFSLVVLDIDFFKEINDRHGHMHGDRMLQQFARLVNDTVRTTDVVARYGGEEFIVVMPYTELSGAATLAERLRAVVDKTLPLATSGGVAEATDDDTPQTLLSRADTALYSAKSAGRNQIFLHDGTHLEPVPEEAPQPLTEETPEPVTVA